jgi:secreted Zn-dependent insulinase-like peptidase
MICDFAMLSLLKNITHQLFFEYARTESQLGYAVGCFADFNISNAGIGLYINSPNSECAIINKHMELFLQTHLVKHLKSLSEATLTNVKNNQIHEFSKPSTSLKELTDKVRVAIHTDLNFNRSESIVSEIKEISLRDLNNFYQQLVFSWKSKYLTLCSGPIAEIEAPGIVWNDISEFRKQLIPAESIIPLRRERLRQLAAIEPAYIPQSESFDDSNDLSQTEHPCCP